MQKTCLLLLFFAFQIADVAVVLFDIPFFHCDNHIHAADPTTQGTECRNVHGLSV